MIDKYIEIEKKLMPMKDLLLERTVHENYKQLFKGFITENGPVIHSPDILFIGINPGAGAYISANNSNKTNETIYPIKLTTCKNKQLFLFEKNNAYGGVYNDKWNSFEWYQRDKKINNIFTKRMIDLLDNIARLQYPSEYKQSPWNNNEPPFWYNKISNRLMYINLYPIATLNTSDLNKILNLLRKDKDILTHFGVRSITNWELRLKFINIVDELVKLISPKVIVCLGCQAFNEFTYLNEKEQILSTTKYNIPVLGFSRQGNWSCLIPDISERIVRNLKNFTE